MKEALDYIYTLNESEQLFLVFYILNHPDYKEDAYSDIVRKLITDRKEGKRISEDGFSILRSHLAFKKYIWWNDRDFIV